MSTAAASVTWPDASKSPELQESGKNEAEAALLVEAVDAPVAESVGSSAELLSDQNFVHLTSIALTGSTVFSDSEVESVAGPYLNRTVSISELQSLRVALTRMYVDRGYFSSGVVIPDQTITNGHLELLALENGVTRVEVVGPTRVGSGYIVGRMQRFTDGPANLESLKRALRYLENDPLIDRVVAKIAPGEEAGTSLLSIGVEDEPRFQVEVGADNSRASSVGEERGRVAVSARNLTGFGEHVQYARGYTEGVDEVSASFEVPVSYRDTRLQAYYSTGDAKIVESRFRDLDIGSVSETVGASIWHPLFRNERNEISLSIAFERKRSDSELLGVPFSFSPGAIEGETTVAASLLELGWVNSGNNHLFSLSGGWRRGWDALDATIFEPRDQFDRLANPTGADGEFDLYLLQSSYLLRLNALPVFSEWHDLAQLRIRSSLQVASESLMSLERIAIGGVSTVRGFSENYLVRDSGFSVGVELQFPVYGYDATVWWRNLVLSVFTEYGRAWDKEAANALGTTEDTSEAADIAGVGAGFVWRPLSGLKLSLSLAEQLVDDGVEGDSDYSLQGDGINWAATYTYRF